METCEKVTGRKAVIEYNDRCLGGIGAACRLIAKNL
jgi:hypothetical protein